MIVPGDREVVEAFDMVVDSVGDLARNLDVVDKMTRDLLSDQKVRTSSSVKCVSAARTAACTGRRGLILKDLSGYAFDVEKEFDGEAVTAYMATVYVTEPRACSLLKDCIRALLLSTGGFGPLHAVLSCCFPPNELCVIAAVLASEAHEGVTCQAIGISPPCGSTRRGTHVLLEDEILQRCLDANSRHATMTTMIRQDRLASVRGFRQQYEDSWRNVWFLPCRKWVARDISCCMRVLVACDGPCTTDDIARFMRMVVLDVMMVPEASVFRVRVSNVGTPVSLCMDVGEQETVEAERTACVRLCGVLGSAIRVQEGGVHPRHSPNALQEIRCSAGPWYAMQVVDAADVKGDVDMFYEQSVASRMRAFAGSKAVSLAEKFLASKFNEMSAAGGLHILGGGGGDSSTSSASASSSDSGTDSSGEDYSYSSDGE